MVQYDWEILSLYTAPSVDGLNNVVKRVTWRYQAKEGSYAGDIYKDTYFNAPENSDQFIEYDDLSQDTIVGWIESVENMEEVRAEVLARLETSKRPAIVERSVPWDHLSKYEFEDMYVLVHNDEVVYGPVHWHSNLMNDHLVKIGLEASLPMDIMARKQGIVPIEQPTIINSNTKIYKADMQNEQPESSLFSDNGHIIWDFSTGIAVGTYVAVDKPIEDIKTNLRDVVANKRNEKEVIGTQVVIGDQTYKIRTGPFARTMLVAKLTVMNDNDTCVYKFEDNKWAEVTKNDVLTMLRAVETYVQSVIDWEYDINQQIEATDSVNTLKEIDLN